MKNNQLFAGAGTAPISFPEELFPLEGFRVVHDEPMARVMLLNCEEQIAIACLELVMLDNDGINSVKEIISKETGTKAENIWVHVTHVITTPHAPHAPRGPGGVALEISEEDQKHLEHKLGLFNNAVMTAVKEATQGAKKTFRRAQMGIGVGECYVNVNRDISTPYGWWVNFAPEGPSNHTATILRFNDENGMAIAALISYGLKPCAIDNSEMEVNNRLVSSDVPGLACRLLEEQLGAPCMFAMGAAGDQVPVEQAWYDVVNDDGTVSKVDIGVEAGLKIVDRLGHQMASDLGPVLEGVVCDQSSPGIRLDSGGIEWEGKERNRMKPTLKAEFISKGTAKVEVHTISIGNVALVAVKPEICTVTEQQLKKASPYEHTLLISMVNGGFKYMPDIASYENITWEAQSSALMPGAAEAWVEEAQIVLNRMFKN